jgi:DNA-binding Lrp family transcriptional regulator
VPYRLTSSRRPKRSIRYSFAAKVLQLSEPPVYAAVRRLEEAGILREITGRQRGKLYVYDEYLALLNEGTTGPAS